jgi:ribosomal protein S18 acetylase RimI-like enzyme
MIREARADEAGTIRRLQAQAWQATYPNDDYGVTQAWVEQYVATWLTPAALAESVDIVGDIIADPAAFYRVAEVDGQIVGFVHAQRRLDEAELMALYITPPVFGSGVGAQLMTAALNWIGPQRMVLNVAPYNARAIRFYRRYGFQEVPGSERLFNVMAWGEARLTAAGQAPPTIGLNALPIITLVRPVQT